MKQLRIWDSLGIIAVIIQNDDGKISVKEASHLIEKDLFRWINKGISGLEGEIGKAKLFKTLPGDPKLFDRIEERARMYGFETEIKEIK